MDDKEIWNKVWKLKKKVTDVILNYPEPVNLIDLSRKVLDEIDALIDEEIPEKRI